MPDTAAQAPPATTLDPDQLAALASRLRKGYADLRRIDRRNPGGAEPATKQARNRHQDAIQNAAAQLAAADHLDLVTLVAEYDHALRAAREGRRTGGRKSLAYTANRRAATDRRQRIDHYLALRAG